MSLRRIHNLGKIRKRCLLFEGEFIYDFSRDRHKFEGKLHPGSIFLLHDGGGERSNTVNALELTLAHMKESGYQLLTISEMLKMDEK